MPGMERDVIVGTGVDLIEIDRVRAAYRRRAQRFLKRLFTPAESSYCLRKKDPSESLAGRFAAKEAALKAFSHGFGGRWKWRDIEVVREPSGKPTLKLHGRFEELRVERGISRMHLSIAHSKGDALAWVILEKD
jgi:holo-[acyl-carrier protein] synthase